MLFSYLLNGNYSRMRGNNVGDIKRGNLREPTVGGANGYVENEVKWLVKRRVGATRLAPCVLVNRLVNSDTSELPVFPHVLVLGKVEKNDLLQAGDGPIRLARGAKKRIKRKRKSLVL